MLARMIIGVYTRGGARSGSTKATLSAPIVLPAHSANPPLSIGFGLSAFNESRHPADVIALSSRGSVVGRSYVHRRRCEHRRNAGFDSGVRRPLQDRATCHLRDRRPE
jgi:hypothetical protein